MSNNPIPGEFADFHQFCHREDPVYLKGKNGLFQCPCCKHFTLDGVAQYNICPVCFWEDDGTTSEHGFSPNGVTLTEGQMNYQKFGACEERILKYVRPATDDEVPENG